MKRLLVLSAFLLLAGCNPIFAQSAPTNLPGCQYQSAPPTLADKQTTVLRCDNAGQLQIGGTISAETTANATAADPSYSEGVAEPLSQDLSGHLRVTGTLTPAGTQDVNVTKIGGNAVTTTLPVSGTVTANLGTLNGAATAANQSTEITALGTINTTLGTPMQQTGGTVGLVAGTAIVGKVGIDQTTPGTTNGVQVNAALPAGSNVIGHVITDTSSTTAVTGTVAVTQSTSPWIAAGGGTAGSAATGVMTVQGIASMTPITVTDGSGAMNVIVDSGTLTAVTSITNPVTVTDGAGALNVIVDSGTITAVTAITNALPAGSNIIGNVRIDQTTPGTTNGVVLNAGTTGATPVPTVPAISTISTSVTRPSDTNAYSANDALSNSTSSPTSGGFTFTSACRASGGYGTILDAVVSASAGTAYQGELWVYDQAATNINDNSAFTSSDSDILNLVGVIPFTTSDVTAANSISYVTGLGIGYTCSGTANLRFLVKIMTAVTPASAEVMAVRIKVQN